MIDARYSPVSAPEFRLFFEAKPIRYWGELNVKDLSEWLFKKVALPDNRIGTFKNLKKKVQETGLLVVYIAEKN